MLSPRLILVFLRWVWTYGLMLGDDFPHWSQEPPFILTEKRSGYRKSSNAKIKNVHVCDSFQYILYNILGYITLLTYGRTYGY